MGTLLCWADVDDDVPTKDETAAMPEAFCETLHDVLAICECDGPESCGHVEVASADWFCPAACPTLVHNTFIHTPVAPLASTSRRRAHSLPAVSSGHSQLARQLARATSHRRTHSLPVDYESLDFSAISSPSLNLVPPTPEMCALPTPESWAPTASVDNGPRIGSESHVVQSQFPWNVDDPTGMFSESGLIEQLYLQEEAPFFIQNECISSIFAFSEFDPMLLVASHVQESNFLSSESLWWPEPELPAMQLSLADCV